MELPTALHHSKQVEGPREGEVRETCEALLRHKAPLTGLRPAPLTEVAGPVGHGAPLW